MSLVSGSSGWLLGLVVALPEMLQTAWGALFRSLRLTHRERLLIRGGTTSVGLAAALRVQRQPQLWRSNSRSRSDEHATA